MVIVFDLDDTLFPESAFAVSALREVGRLAIQAHGWDDFGLKLVELHAEGYRPDLFQAAAKATGRGELSSGQLKTFLACYREHRPTSLPWYPDALEAVRGLRQVSPLELISDGYLPTQRHKAEALDLNQWIDRPVFTEELGRAHWKPAPTAFELVMARHPGEAFVYVGDNPTKDFVAPRALGWQTVRIRRPEGVYAGAFDAPGGSPDIVLPDMTGLRSALRIS
jgi:putative hydrolase of the HAD superfamily